MSLKFTVLGSGSGGNSTLVIFEKGVEVRHVLIDAGLSPRQTAKRLKSFGFELQDIDCILLTHLDGDHFGVSWQRVCQRFDIDIHLHRRHYRRVPEARRNGVKMNPFDGQFQLDNQTMINPVLFAHDALGTVGYVIEHAGYKLGFATDLGRVPDMLYEYFYDLDALAIESNYDREMQIRSGRPAFLKKRIMGGNGHISNDQSLEAVIRIAEQSQLQHIVPLHLSRQCNDPILIERMYEELASHLRAKLTISSQFEATAMLGLVKDKRMVTFQPIQDSLF